MSVINFKEYSHLVDQNILPCEQVLAGRTENELSVGEVAGVGGGVSDRGRGGWWCQIQLLLTTS